VVKDAVGTVLVPRPTNSSGPVLDTELLRWASKLIKEVFSKA
jgi:hypothetical protein